MSYARLTFRHPMYPDGSDGLRLQVRRLLLECEFAPACDGWRIPDAEVGRRLAAQELGHSALDRHVVLEELLASGAPLASHWDGREGAGLETFLGVFPLLRGLVATTSLEDEPAVERLGRLTARLWALRRLSLSVARAIEAGEEAHAEGAVVADLGARFRHDVTGVAPAGAPAGIVGVLVREAPEEAEATVRGWLRGVDAPEDVRRLGALLSAVRTAGAMERTLEVAAPRTDVTGRHAVATLTGEVACAATAVDHALEFPGDMEVAAAKVSCDGDREWALRLGRGVVEEPGLLWGHAPARGTD